MSRGKPDMEITSEHKKRPSQIQETAILVLKRRYFLFGVLGDTTIFVDGVTTLAAVLVAGIASG